MILAAPSPSGGRAPRRNARDSASAPEHLRAADIPGALLAEEAARCRALWGAVVVQSLEEARNAGSLGRDARSFIASESFARAARAAGLDPEKARAAAPGFPRPRMPLEAEAGARLRALAAERPGIWLREAVAVLEAEGVIDARRGMTLRRSVGQGRAGVRVVRVRAPSGRLRIHLWPMDSDQEREG